MKFTILSALFMVCIAYSTADPFGSGSDERGGGFGRGGFGGGGWGGGGWPTTCPTVTPAALATDPFVNSPWYEVQRSPRTKGYPPSCVTYTFGSGFGTPVNHGLVISRKVGFTGSSSITLSIVSQTSAASAAGTFESWNNIHSTADTSPPSTYSVLGLDTANPPTWVVLYWCQKGQPNVRILTSTATPTVATLQAAQALITSYNIPNVSLVTVSQTGC